MTLLDAMVQRGFTPRVALYARFSSDNQRDESIDAQLRAMYEYCKRVGAVVINEYIDRAKSATTDDRPQFLQLIADSKKEEFDFVIVHKLDRFSRNRCDSAIYKVELKRHNISVISVLEQLDDSPEAIMLESMLEGMAEYYSKNLSREVKKGLRESALKCMHIGGQAPYGLSVDPLTRQYIINPDEAPTIKFIFTQVANGVGYSEIVRQLHSMGVRTRNNKFFSKTSIYDIIRNEKYKGTYIYNRTAQKMLSSNSNNAKLAKPEDIIKIENVIEPIIDSDTFDLVTKIVNSRRRSTPINTKETYLLAGKIFCGECGAAMTGNRKFSGRNKNLYVTYRCGRSNLKARVDCTNKEINRDKIEKFVLSELSKVIFNDKILDTILDNYNSFCNINNADDLKRISSIQNRLSVIQSRIDNLIDVIASSGSSNIIKALSNLEDEQTQLQVQLQKYKSDLSNKSLDNSTIRLAFEKARSIFFSDSFEDRKILIHHFLNKVVVYNQHIEIFINMLPTYIYKVDSDLLDSKNAHFLTLTGSDVSHVGGGEAQLQKYRLFCNVRCSYPNRQIKTTKIARNLLHISKTSSYHPYSPT